MFGSFSSVMTLLDLLSKTFLGKSCKQFWEVVFVLFFSLGYVYPYKFAMKNNKILNSNFKYIEMILRNSSVTINLYSFGLYKISSWSNIRNIFLFLLYLGMMTHIFSEEQWWWSEWWGTLTAALMIFSIKWRDLFHVSQIYLLFSR